MKSIFIFTEKVHSTEMWLLWEKQHYFLPR